MANRGVNSIFDSMRYNYHKYVLFMNNSQPLTWIFHLEPREFNLVDIHKLLYYNNPTTKNNQLMINGK